ncbi:transcriptional repressor [Candidatus Saccharibacteria bacterium]|nr:transcriptional repressor [Candidatus Saccharibacteria bacterium]
MQIDDSIQSKFLEQLKANGLRFTHVRQEIFYLMASENEPLSIQYIASKINNAHFVSIYRSIDALQKAGIVKQVPQGFKNLFELSDMFKPHHHHATCEICSKSIEINNKRIEILMKELTKEAGLIPTKHHFEMYGICNNCSEGLI